LLAKIKPNKIYLVTDALAPTGTPTTDFIWAGKRLTVKDGRCVDASGRLGGSTITMNDTIKNCVEVCNIGLDKALTMATSIPAQVMKLDHKMGKID
jgi:N-acetylglucosamine-6-phosphate deacetylase